MTNRLLIRFFNKIKYKYKTNPNDILNFAFLFILILPLMIYFYGLQKGIFIFFTMIIVVGVLPFIINLVFNYFVHKVRLTKYFLLLVSIYFSWLLIAYFYMDIKYILFTFTVSLALFGIVRFINYLKK